MMDDLAVPFTPPFQKVLPVQLLGPLYEATKPAIAQASQVLTLGVQPKDIFPGISEAHEVEASALSLALALGNLTASSYASAIDVFGRERAHDWLVTMLQWFSALQEQHGRNIQVRIIERE